MREGGSPEHGQLVEHVTEMGSCGRSPALLCSTGRH